MDKEQFSKLLLEEIENGRSLTSLISDCTGGRAMQFDTASQNKQQSRYDKEISMNNRYYANVQGPDPNAIMACLKKASMAFAAARSIDKEFRKDCIWIPIAGYAAATAIGVERVVNKHHHWYDVVAGAGIGFGSAELTWWLSDLMFGKGHNVAVGSSGNTVDVVYNF